MAAGTVDHVSGLEEIVGLLDNQQARHAMSRMTRPLMVVSASGGGLGFQLTPAESEFQSQKMTEVKIDHCPCGFGTTVLSSAVLQFRSRFRTSVSRLN
jgi:hypothetical protein